DWKFSQEDIQVGLVWGSQELQRTAQQVRKAENKIIQFEKLAAMQKFYHGVSWPEKEIDEAWRNLMLAQHHDCWIVPLAWSGRVANWMKDFDKSLNKLSPGQSDQLLNATHVNVVNTSGRSEKQFVSIPINESKVPGYIVRDDENRLTPSFITTDRDGNVNSIAFLADVPATRSVRYEIIRQTKKTVSTFSESVKRMTSEARERFTDTATASRLSNGDVILETNLYRLSIDKSGVIRSLYSKELKKEFVDLSSSRGFNTLQGYSWMHKKTLQSDHTIDSVSIIRYGKWRVAAIIYGKLWEHQFQQSITLTSQQRRIDMQVTIDWNEEEGIGDPYAQQNGQYNTKDLRKAFYVDTAKLNVSFPLQLQNQKIYKDAPFDVTESRLQNTFYNSWDSIKNNIIYRWVDVADSVSGYGLALFTDHTTSYSHGQYFPLSLTLAYSGSALWSNAYKLKGKTEVNYSLIPHKGLWHEAGIQREASFFNEPLLVRPGTVNETFRGKVVDLDSTDFELTSMQRAGDTTIIRIYNSEGDERLNTIILNEHFTSLQFVELDGRANEPQKISGGRIEISLPRFGIRTIRLW
ncbi:MAG: hypothetical protein EOO02_14220, partial [Chitinophagaceae bacterium]